VNFDLSNQVVVVTGAAGNLGQSVARAFFSAGACLVPVDRSPNRLAEIFPEWTGSDQVLFANEVDLTQPEQVEGMVNMAMDRFGRIDVLANIAGGFGFGSPVHESSLDIWQHMMSINLHTALITSQAVARRMVEQGKGKIINVGARAGLQGGARMAAYSSSKAAIIRLTESMAAELKGNGINVNCVLPSTIDTPDNRRSMPKADPSKWVAPDALADVILFLASDAARAIQGAAIPVYGKG